MASFAAQGLTIQKGDGEPFTAVTQAPPVVRLQTVASKQWFETVSPRSRQQQAERIVDSHQSAVQQFIQGQRQNYNAGIITGWRKSFTFDDLNVEYTMRDGFETIVLTAYPENNGRSVPRKRDVILGRSFTVKYGYPGDPDNYVITTDPKGIGVVGNDPKQHGTGFFQAGFIGYKTKAYWEVRIRKLPRTPDPEKTTTYTSRPNGSYTDTTTYYSDPTRYTTKLVPNLNTFRTPIIGLRAAFADDASLYSKSDPLQRWSANQLLADNPYGDNYSFNSKLNPPPNRSIGLLPTSSVTSTIHTHTETPGYYTTQVSDTPYTPTGRKPPSDPSVTYVQGDGVPGTNQSFAVYQSLYAGAVPPITYPDIVMEAGVMTADGNDLFQVYSNYSHVKINSRGPTEGTGNSAGMRFEWPGGSGVYWVRLGTAGQAPYTTNPTTADVTNPPTVRFYPKTPTDTYTTAIVGDNFSFPPTVAQHAGYDTRVFKGNSQSARGGIVYAQDYPIANGYPWNGVATPTVTGALKEGDIVMVAVDTGSGNVWFGINGKWLRNADLIHGDPGSARDNIPPATYLDLKGDDLKPVQGSKHNKGYVPAIGFDLKDGQQLWVEIVYDASRMKYQMPTGFGVVGSTTISVD